MIEKKRDDYDTDDRLDYLDGWHTECGLGFKTKRDLGRRVKFRVPEPTADGKTRMVPHHQSASVAFDHGRRERMALREIRGI